MWRLRAPLLALLLMQVILLASSGVTATKKPLGKQETCNMKNHMIEYLRNNGVQIYERPQNLSPFCTHEWKKYGTCCEPEGIKQSVTQKVRSNNFGLAQLIKEMSSAVLKLTEFRKKYLDLPLAARAKKIKQAGNGVTFSTALSPEAEEQFKSDLRQLDHMNRTLHEDLNSRIALQKTCVAELNSVISKSACSICSGRSDDFFSQDDRLLVSEPTCRAVLTKCNDAWTDMVEFTSDVAYYAHVIRKLILHYGFEIKDEAVEEKAFTMNLDSFITNRNLIPIMEKCKRTKLKACSFEHVAALCEQFIHIQAPTYIESSQSQSDLLISRLNKIYNDAVSNFTACEGHLKGLQDGQASQGTFLNRKLYLLNQTVGLYEVDKELVNLRDLWVELKLQAPLLGNLMPTVQGELLNRLDACSQKVEQLLATFLQRWVKLLLGKHSHLVDFLKEASLITDKKKFDPKSRNQVASLLWNKLHLAIEMIVNPNQNLSLALGTGLGSSQDFAVVLRGMYTHNLIMYFNAQAIQQVLQSHLPKGTAGTETTYKKLAELGVVGQPETRGLTMLFASSTSKPGIRDFLAETMVVRNCEACIQIGEGIAGIPLTFEGP